jgi:maltooligosyltrehalose trehalohydrolase
MATFRVWAPERRCVELQAAGRRLAMQRATRGWWTIDAPWASPGTDYAFVLDDGPPLPDPRSRWQPKGIHGASRLVDPAQFVWTDAAWQPPQLSSGLIYEMHLGTFTEQGTFLSAIERLDYLVELGVTHLEIMPVNEFSGTRGWGYDGVDLYAPHHAYGGPIGLAALVDACHARGLAVILDVVYNHLGPAGNYLGEFGPYFTDRYATPWGAAVNLDDRRSDEVRRFFCDNALMWLRDYHIDGLRLDAVHALIDTSAVRFLEQLAIEVEQLSTVLGRTLVVIAESDLNDPRIVRSRALGGYGLAAQWSDDFHHALHALLTGERQGHYADFGRLGDVAAALEGGFVYAGRYSEFRERSYGRPASGLSGHAFVGCVQNHDQVGNRAGGERLTHLVNCERAMIAAALVLTAPFIPMLFQGEEWGASSPFLYFTAHEDPALGERVSAGRRQEFASFAWNADAVPDPQASSTFERSKLDWAEQGRGAHATMLAWYRTLIRLRRTTPALRDGRFEGVHVQFDESSRWLTVERGPVFLACNLSAEKRRVPAAVGQRSLRLASPRDPALGKNWIELPPDGVALLA